VVREDSRTRMDELAASQLSKGMVRYRHDDWHRQRHNQLGLDRG
jgi:hypothetical protein